jgi:hypothetical protein
MRRVLIVLACGLMLAGSLTFPASVRAQGGVNPAEKAAPVPVPPPPPAPPAKPSPPVDLCFARGVVCAPGSTPCCPPMTCRRGTPNVCQ